MGFEDCYHKAATLMTTQQVVTMSAAQGCFGPGMFQICLPFTAIVIEKTIHHLDPPQRCILRSKVVMIREAREARAKDNKEMNIQAQAPSNSYHRPLAFTESRHSVIQSSLDLGRFPWTQIWTCPTSR